MCSKCGMISAVDEFLAHGCRPIRMGIRLIMSSSFDAMYCLRLFSERTDEREVVLTGAGRQDYYADNTGYFDIFILSVVSQFSSRIPPERRLTENRVPRLVDLKLLDEFCSEKGLNTVLYAADISHSVCPYFEFK